MRVGTKVFGFGLGFRVWFRVGIRLWKFQGAGFQGFLRPTDYQSMGSMVERLVSTLGFQF